MGRSNLTEENAKLIVSEFYGDLPLLAIAKKYKVDTHVTIKPLWFRNGITEEMFKERVSRLIRLKKMGTKNPMYGKTKLKHHNAVDIKIINGYRTVFIPDWYTGKTYGNRAYEHIVVYCALNNRTELPKGSVVHHVDHDKHNNNPSNLQLLTISDHMRLHNTKDQEIKSATTIP